jgi:pantoate--beta-alanine ligase
VRGMAEAFFLKTAIVACPTVRESTGLALSSRNARLSAPDRERAAMLHHVLASAATPDDAIDQLADAGFAVDYVDDHEGRRLAAVRFRGVRLIDNVALPGAP